MAFPKAVQSFVKLIHTMNKNNTFVDFTLSSATNIDLKRKLGP